MDKHELDTTILKTILVQDIGTIANIVQAASEYSEGTMTARLSTAYYEVTNQDPGAETDMIGLR